MGEQLLPHKLTLDERKNLTMTGVTEVVSFDETMVVLRTALGTLEVQGQELQLKTLSIDGGQVAVDGKISGDELSDFVYIQAELEKISVAVETLQLWCEQMLDTGIIDRAQYEAVKEASQNT